METDVDAYFAKNDIPSVISDMLFELGFHRPKDVGKFMSAYVERRFHLADASGYASDKRSQADGSTVDDNFSTIEVVNPTRSVSRNSDDAKACALLEEARALGRKYREFRPQPVGDGVRGALKGVGESDMAQVKAELSSITIIPWKEFRLDYDRLLNIFSNPHLWTFCERRLAVLRGLFEAHCALNSTEEEAEAMAKGPEDRCDSCVQSASSLSPHRLMAFYKRKAKDDSSLRELALQLGRRPLPSDMVADPDMPRESVSQLASLFSRTSNSVRGQYLAEAVRESFDLLEKTDENSGGKTYADYRLPIHPESGAWVDLARWATEFSVQSSRARWVVQLSQTAYSGLKEQRSVLNYGELLDNVFGPPSATANASASSSLDPQVEQLATLLETVSGFELAIMPGTNEDCPPTDLDREPWDWTVTTSPPYYYQLYHMWARLKALNWVREDTGLTPLDLRCATATAEPLSCAYLLGVNGTSRCASLASHAPLQYLLALELDNFVVSVSLASKRSLNGVSSEEASKVFSKLFRAGVATTLCTEDITLSHQGDHALAAEYCIARNALSLTEADLAELARNSMSTSNFRQRQRRDEQDESVEESKTIRQRYRLGRREAELKLISSMAQQTALQKAEDLGGAAA